MTLHNHGIIYLILAIIVLVGTQVLMAGPFVDDNLARAMGFKSAETGWLKYLRRIKLLTDPESTDLQLAAEYDNSIQWRILHEEVYNSQAFIDACKVMMLSLNVYYFFIRKACLMQCI